MSDREFLLSLLGNNPSMTQAELAEEMGKSRRSVQTMMKQLNEEGVIERIGSKKAGMWVVK